MRLLISQAWDQGTLTDTGRHHWSGDSVNRLGNVASTDAGGTLRFPTTPFHFKLQDLQCTLSSQHPSWCQRNTNMPTPLEHDMSPSLLGNDNVTESCIAENPFSNTSSNLSVPCAVPQASSNTVAAKSEDNPPCTSDRKAPDPVHPIDNFASPPLTLALVQQLLQQFKTNIVQAIDTNFASQFANIYTLTTDNEPSILNDKPPADIVPALDTKLLSTTVPTTVGTSIQFTAEHDVSLNKTLVNDSTNNSALVIAAIKLQSFIRCLQKRNTLIYLRLDAEYKKNCSYKNSINLSPSTWTSYFDYTLMSQIWQHIFQK